MRVRRCHFRHLGGKVYEGVARYLYEQEDILATFSDTGRELARYTHGPGIDEPLAEARPHRTRFYHADVLGSIVGLTEKHGHSVREYRYSAFGIPEDHRGDPQPYRFTGREWDKETGLYFYRARSYDPNVGRFTQEDLLGFRGGPNLYPYVANNPLRYVDPLGWQKNQAGGIPMPWPFRDPYANLTPSQRVEFHRSMERLGEAVQKTGEQLKEGAEGILKWAIQIVELTSGKGLKGPVIFVPAINPKELFRYLGIISREADAAELPKVGACSLP